MATTRAIKMTTRHNRVMHAIALGVTVVAVVSCEGNLTRADAERVIREQLKLPQHEEGRLVLFARGHNLSRFQEPFQDEGLLTLTFEGESSRASLTAKGKRYTIGDAYVDNGDARRTDTGAPQEEIKIKLFEIEFGEITGIAVSEGSATAQVDYTLVRTPTPFAIAQVKTGEIRGEGTGIPTESRVASHAEFKKYDDGWRMVR